MARITVEDCLKHVPNHFALVVVASKRARDRMKKEQRYTFEGGHKGPVTALLEIANGQILTSGGTLEEHIQASLKQASGELKTVNLEEVI